MGKPLRYPVSTVIASIMMFRTYLLFRLFTRFSKYKSAQADRSCFKVGIEADSVFALRGSFKDNPFILLGFTFIISSICFGLAVRLFERYAIYSYIKTFRPYYDDTGSSMVPIIYTDPTY